MANPAAYGWELPANAEARRAVIERLFMKASDRVRMKADHEALTNDEAGVQWDQFLEDWTWVEICDLCKSVVESPCVSEVYVGITSNVIWRWRNCQDHTEGFDAHFANYMRMLVIHRRALGAGDRNGKHARGNAQRWRARVQGCQPHFACSGAYPRQACVHLHALQ